MTAGGKTCFLEVTSVRLGKALERDLGALPALWAEKGAVWCDDYDFRAGACARTWLRPHAQDNLMCGCGTRPAARALVCCCVSLRARAGLSGGRCCRSSAYCRRPQHSAPCGQVEGRGAGSQGRRSGRALTGTRASRPGLTAPAAWRAAQGHRAAGADQGQVELQPGREARAQL